MSEELKIVAEHYGISVEDADKVLTAFKENRVRIKRKYTDEHCGTCANFMREIGKGTAMCSARKNKYGEPIRVAQSRLSCTRYTPRSSLYSK